ncbi:MAG TPA: DNA-3-methyladenine glycosylase I [Lactobacillus sp.]|nr:DNA-3-methyladenine glycosylase I [Lactobacillus sp.]
MIRCTWGQEPGLMQTYHDQEWGKPHRDDHALFELMCMEMYQAGLSWRTVLNKRAAFNEDFYQYDLERVAKMTAADWEPLLQDKRIIRNRAKLAATVSNAQAFKSIQQKFGSFSKYWWAFVNDQPLINDVHDDSDVPAQTELSVVIAKDLKGRGFKFMGPVAVYAFMQASGLVNDHLNQCAFK